MAIPDDKLVRTLAQLFSNENSATALLLAAGYAIELAPPFRNLPPAEFWRLIVSSFRLDTPPNTTTLVRAALDRYPFNRDLREWLEAHNVAVTPRPAPPPGPALGYTVTVTTDRRPDEILAAARRVADKCKLKTPLEPGLSDETSVSVDLPGAAEADAARVAEWLPVELVLPADRVAVRPRKFQDYYIERLEVEGPDGRRFEVSNVPASTSAREIARQVMAEYDPGAVAGPAPVVVSRLTPRGTVERISGEESLHESAVGDGATIYVAPLTFAGGGGGPADSPAGAPDAVRRWFESVIHVLRVPPEVERFFADHFARPTAPAAPAAAPPAPAPPAAATADARDVPGVVYIASNPRSTMQLQLGDELREIEGALQAVIELGFLRFKAFWGAQRDDLSLRLRDFGPGLIQFSGHGTPDGILLGAPNNRSAELVEWAGLCDILRLVNRPRPLVRCVFLNGCHSAAAADALAEVVDLFIGSAANISDDASQHFSRGFYSKLSGRKSYLDAITEGKQRMEARWAQLTDPGAKKDNDPALIQYRARAGIDPAKMFLLT